MLICGASFTKNRPGYSYVVVHNSSPRVSGVPQTTSSRSRSIFHAFFSHWPACNPRSRTLSHSTDICPKSVNFHQRPTVGRPTRSRTPCRDYLVCALKRPIAIGEPHVLLLPNPWNHGRHPIGLRAVMHCHPSIRLSALRRSSLAMPPDLQGHVPE